MKFLRYLDSRWEKTLLPCGRCGNDIYREVRKSKGPTNHFSCSREGCTWPDYHAKELSDMLTYGPKWKSSPDRFRRTGRTTRMLEYAVNQAKSGHYDIVYCLTGDELKRQFEQAAMMDDKGLPMNPSSYGGKIKFGPGSVSFELINESFDWRTLTNPGVYSDVVSLVDHHALESQFPAITQMLYRFMEFVCPECGDELNQLCPSCYAKACED